LFGLLAVGIDGQGVAGARFKVANLPTASQTKAKSKDQQFLF
jgi:hypothetical protein